MTDHGDLNTERDMLLGKAVRDYLNVPDDTAFTASVMARIRLESRETSWDILAAWAPLGMAAAALLALVSGLLLGIALKQEPVEPVLAEANDPVTEWLTAPEPITDDFMLTAILARDDRRQRGER